MPVQLKAVQRTQTGSAEARKIRRQGQLPAVVYGGQETIPLAVDQQEFERLVQRGERVVELVIDGQAPRTVQIYDLQYASPEEIILHVDFKEIREGAKIRIELPIELTGQAVGVKAGGVLHRLLHEVEVECDPAAIPESIRLEVAGLKLGETLYVRDLRLPQGVRLLHEAHEPVCSIYEARAEPEAEAAVPAPEAKAPEVLTERKVAGKEEPREKKE